VPQVSALGDA